MKLLTKEIEKAFTKQGDTSNMPTKDIKIVCKFFNPMGAGTWYLYERDKNEPDIFWCFANLGDPTFAECGTVSLSEIESIRLPFGMKIERDMHFPVLKKSLADIIDTVKGGGHV
jgi:hypothetical protein